MLPADDAVLPASLRRATWAGHDVCAGAEDIRGAGQDADPVPGIVLEVVQRVVEFLGGRAVDGVAFGGSLDADHGDAPVRLFPDHRSTPFSSI